MQINDPDVIEQLCAVADEDRVPKPPPWWRFNDLMHRITDVADQMIAARATSDKVKFYPRPINPAVKERERRKWNKQDDLIERSRKAHEERRARENGLA